MPTNRIAQALQVWGYGFSIGCRTLPRAPVLGLKRLLLPVSYWRCAEFAYVMSRLPLHRGAKILDLGSPKDLATILARTNGCEIEATDILPEAIELSQRYNRAQGLDGVGPGRVRSVCRDGRALSYADNSFDAAYSVSVLEHIPHDGDHVAVGELLRVVKPGGVVVITVPYDLQYRETFVDRAVYERARSSNEQVFFERHYDAQSLRDRIIAHPSAHLIDQEIWGEKRIRMERMLSRAGRLRDVLSPLEPALSMSLLSPIGDGDAGHPMATFLTLRKDLTHQR
jgi:SAM-dependent methyltransferase